MSAERDDELQDELLRRVVDELRRPVRLDPTLDLRVLRAIREPAPARPARPWLRPAWVAAALAAGVMIAVGLQSRDRPSSSPTTVASPAATPFAESTRPVYLRLDAPASSRVSVVGDFNDWDPSATPLSPTGDRGVWTVELRLKPGRYHYTFLIDGRRWAGDPSEPRAPESDFGAPVSVLTVS
ncbi:MAG TPA: isoamylase early set domain-containing protein [Gemmatimonadales bacterium]